MLHAIKNFLYFSAFISLIFLAGCGRDSDKTTPTGSPGSQYTLSYTAGKNGTIEGLSPQTVIYGGAGSTVRAVPSDGYHFVNWSDGLTTASRTDSSVTTDLAVTASFSINQYTLTYTSGGNGAIEGPAYQTVNHGNSAIPVKAVPAEHYHFVSWSDGVNTAERTDSQITADLAQQASFAIDTYTVTYIAGDNGSINGNTIQEVGYGGSTTIVTATPADGYHFEQWSDGATTAQRIDSGVTGPLELRASFSINHYTLNYSAGKNGTIEGARQQTVVHGSNATQVTAVPAEHYHFVKWSDGVETVQRSDQGVHSKLAVTAVFAIDQYTLTYSADENGTIKGASSQTVGHGGTGSKVTAVPAASYHFENWSDGLTTASRTDSSVTGDLSVTAHFTINQYTLSYTAGEHGTIEGVNPQKINHGSDASPVTAVAEQGYHFVSWSDGMDTAQRHDRAITSVLTASAAFEVNTYKVGGSVSGLVKGTTVILQNNGGDDLEVTTEGGFVFTTELLHAQSYKVTVLSQPTSPNQTCTVTGGAGAIAFEDITSVEVTCVLNKYSIGGTISVVPKNDQVVLQNNTADDLVLTANGPFTFNTPLDDGSQYEVIIKNQPGRPHWKCTVGNGSGTLAGTDVSDILVDCYPEAYLKATAGIKRIILEWNSQDFNEFHKNIVAFNICRAEEAIPADRFRDCRNLIGGIVEKRLKDSPYTLRELTNNQPYWFQLQVLADAGNRNTISKVVKAIPFGGLNDTGIDWCADDHANSKLDETRVEKIKVCDALAATHPEQDALHGWDALTRDRKMKKTGYGSAGFDFTKVCMNGDRAGEGDCPPNPSLGNGMGNWACTHDNTTDLTWEIKSDKGLQSLNNTYTWYQQKQNVNGGEPGVNNGGTCEGSDCDTLDYVKAVNEMKLCGATDWRLPTKKELLSLVDNSRFSPAVDDRFFPLTLPSYYWSSSPYPDQTDSAWQVYFLYGEALPRKKSQESHVRLVRGQTVTFGYNNP